MGNFALPLSSTCFGSSGWVLVDASVNRLRCQSNQISDWQLHSMRLRSGSIRHRLGIDELSIIWFHLIPWGIAPPWAWWPVICIYPGTASSSKLVRTGLRCYCSCTVFFFHSGIKKLWRQDLWCNALHVWMLIVKCLWGIICFCLSLLCWLIVGLEGESSLLLG